MHLNAKGSKKGKEDKKGKISVFLPFLPSLPFLLPLTIHYELLILISKRPGVPGVLPVR
jgi:hypothetical protein